MRVLFILCLTFLCAIGADAQSKSQVKWGEFYKKKGGMFARFELIGNDDNHYYVNMRPEKKGGTLLKFNFDHKLVSTTPINLNYKKEKLKPRNFFETAAGQFSFMPDYDKKSKTLNILVAPFNKGKFGTVKKAYSQKYKVQYKLFWFGLFGYSDNDVSSLEGLEISANKKYALFTNSSSTKEKNAPEELTFVVFDENMDIVWEKKQTFPYRGKDVSTEDIIISNNGEVLFVAYVSEKKKKGDKKSNGYKAFRVTKDGFDEIPLNVKGDKSVVSVGIFAQEATNDLYMAGFYSEEDVKGMNGVFFGKVDINAKSFDFAPHKFTSEFREGLVRKRALNKKDAGISYAYSLRNLISHLDNTFSVVSEERFITTHTSTNSNGQTTTYYKYHSNEIVIPRFSKNGELLNIEKIDKTFDSRIELERSFSINSFNNKSFLVFNDEKRRSERKKEGMKKARRYTDLCIIGEDGKIENRYNIFTNKEAESFYIPSLSFKKDDKLILCGVTKRFKKYRFGTLKLN